MTNPAGAPLSVDAILFTDDLHRRPSRRPDHAKENRALLLLTRILADSPQSILQVLADTILDLLQCGSAGVSLLTTHDGGKRFYWPAIAGVWKPHIGGGTPRDFGPCGTVLDRDSPLLFKHVEKIFTYFEPVKPAVEEALLVPFYVAGKAVGTVWAVAHDDTRLFDLEDKRLLTSMSQFASAAYQVITVVDASRQFAAIVESSDDAIVSKNLDGVITSWNKGAERLFGYTAEEAVGRHITQIIPPDRTDEENTIIERIRRGERVDHFETVRMRKDGTFLDISVTISPLKNDAGVVVGASKVARDMTERKRAERAHQELELSARLLQVQDEERRRIARELHDGVGQLLAAVSMNINTVRKEKDKLSPAAAQRVTENAVLIQQVSADIRTVSYLLHPPLLDEMGLRSALGWYIEGFAERSKIDAKLEVAADWGRMPQDSELCLFRIAQECLTNIHRHSGSRTALVKLWRTPRGVNMEVSDEGRGLSQEKLPKIASGESAGVGLRGMRERVKLLGGTFDVHSNEKGVTVLVSLPLNEKSFLESSAASKGMR